jgi:peptidoglycan/xylan/chitin deacetylase (PgdA/CDA1 family)
MDQVEIIYRISRSPLGQASRGLSRKRSRIILAYHGIASGHRLCLSGEAFENQIRFLVEHYRIVPLKEIYTEKHVYGEKPTVALTFDDGYRNFLEVGLPLLASRQLPATVYVPVNYMGMTNQWDLMLGAPPLPIMTGQELREIASCGVEIGSHTLSHARLSELNSHELRGEIFDSKKQLEDILGCEIRSFAYPYGGRKDLGGKAGEMIKNAGYSNATTSIFGRFNTAKSRYALRRITVWPTDTFELFRAKLRGDFDWLIFKEGLRSLV